MTGFSLPTDFLSCGVDNSFDYLSVSEVSAEYLSFSQSQCKRWDTCHIDPIRTLAPDWSFIVIPGAGPPLVTMTFPSCSPTEWERYSIGLHWAVRCDNSRMQTFYTDAHSNTHTLSKHDCTKSDFKNI